MRAAEVTARKGGGSTAIGVIVEPSCADGERRRTLRILRLHVSPSLGPGTVVLQCLLLRRKSGPERAVPLCVGPLYAFSYGNFPYVVIYS